jgi:hypothetical protein
MTRPRSVRPRVTSSVITPRSSAHLKRPPLVVVLDSPFVAADYAEQISHGSPSSTSGWMALALRGSGPASPSVLACLLASGLPGFGNTGACRQKTKSPPQPSAAKPC